MPNVSHEGALKRNAAPAAAKETERPASTVVSAEGVWIWTRGGVPTVTFCVTNASAPILSLAWSVTLWIPSIGWRTRLAPLWGVPSTV